MDCESNTNSRGKQVLKQLRKIGPFLPASMTVTRTKCGNPRCRCANEGPVHETALLTWKEDGTTRTLHVPRELRREVAQWIAEWKKLKKLIQRMGDAQKQFLKTRRRSIKRSSGRS